MTRFPPIFFGLRPVALLRAVSITATRWPVLIGAAMSKGRSGVIAALRGGPCGAPGSEMIAAARAALPWKG